mmetsp:Transcript_34278/g.90161  ORF Transcript_34278/g.90161 Transcript_34278/m.90161 type:complete len:398 (-) Transcript_34278:288-1481(-)
MVRSWHTSLIGGSARTDSGASREGRSVARKSMRVPTIPGCATRGAATAEAFRTSAPASMLSDRPSALPRSTTKCSARRTSLTGVALGCGSPPDCPLSLLISMAAPSRSGTWCALRATTASSVSWGMDATAEVRASWELLGKAQMMPHAEQIVSQAPCKSRLANEALATLDVCTLISTGKEAPPLRLSAPKKAEASRPSKQRSGMFTPLVCEALPLCVCGGATSPSFRGAGSLAEALACNSANPTVPAAKATVTGASLEEIMKPSRVVSLQIVWIKWRRSSSACAACSKRSQCERAPSDSRARAVAEVTSVEIALTNTGASSATMAAFDSGGASKGASAADVLTSGMPSLRASYTFVLIPVVSSTGTAIIVQLASSPSISTSLTKPSSSMPWAASDPT